MPSSAVRLQDGVGRLVLEIEWEFLFSAFLAIEQVRCYYLKLHRGIEHVEDKIKLSCGGTLPSRLAFLKIAAEVNVITTRVLQRLSTISKFASKDLDRLVRSLCS